MSTQIVNDQNCMKQPSSSVGDEQSSRTSSPSGSAEPYSQGMLSNSSLKNKEGPENVNRFIYTHISSLSPTILIQQIVIITSQNLSPPSPLHPPATRTPAYTSPPRCPPSSTSDSDACHRSRPNSCTPYHKAHNIPHLTPL